MAFHEGQRLLPVLLHLLFKLPLPPAQLLQGVAHVGLVTGSHSRRERVGLPLLVVFFEQLVG